MSKMIHSILSTKKLDPSTMEMAKERGFDIREIEFIQIRPVPSQEIIDKLKIIHILANDRLFIFTSANALNSLKQIFESGPDSKSLLDSIARDSKIACISGRTKDLAGEIFPHSEIIATGENAEQLAVEIINKWPKEKDIIFFSGDKRRGELPEMLIVNGFNFQEIILYENHPVQMQVKDDYDAILFFSPSAVESFFSCNTISANTVCFAIGNTTASGILNFSDNTIAISKTPSQQGMLEAIEFYNQNYEQFEQNKPGRDSK